MQREIPKNGEPHETSRWYRKMNKPGQVMFGRLVSLSFPGNTDLDLNHCDQHEFNQINTVVPLAKHAANC